MNTRRAIAGLALFAVALGLPAAARAQDENRQSLLARLNYCAQGSIMGGVGPQGRPLGRGPSFSLNVNGESSLGMELGFEAAYASSNDILNTRFASLCAIVRLSPTPEEYRAFVQLGAGAFHVSYSPDAPGLAAPANSVRPGGNFGVGFDLLEQTRFSAGAILQYNGVILARNEGRSYLTAGVMVTFKPVPY